MSTKEIERARIIPDVVDALAHSKVQISASFGSIPVVLGEHIAPKDSSSKPTVTISGTDDHALYTLICTDPDAPDPANPTRGEFVHWVITNISKGDISTGNEILPYTGPAPPIGVHRYIFLLYKQPAEIKYQAPEARIHYKVRQEAEKYELGDPEAIIYFVSSK